MKRQYSNFYLLGLLGFLPILASFFIALYMINEAKKETRAAQIRADEAEARANNAENRLKISRAAYELLWRHYYLVAKTYRMASFEWKSAFEEKNGKGELKAINARFLEKEAENLWQMVEKKDGKDAKIKGDLN